jgi:hypothetical protein
VLSDSKRLELSLTKEKEVREELKMEMNRKSLEISEIKSRVLDKNNTLNESEVELDTVSYNTNDSSRSGNSSRFSFKFPPASEEFIFDEGDNNPWKVEAIDEEDGETSSVGGDEITPRRLEEDQEEMARINEELNSARMQKKFDVGKGLQLTSKKPDLHLSHISSVNNSRDETAFMSPTSAGHIPNIKIPTLQLDKIHAKRAAL